MVQTPSTIHMAKREHFQSCMVPQKIRLMAAVPVFKSSANLPLQPHFWLLPQLTTAAYIPGRCSSVVWSQLSPSSSGPHYKSLFGASLLAASYYNTSLQFQFVLPDY